MKFLRDLFITFYAVFLQAFTKSPEPEPDVELLKRQEQPVTELDSWAKLTLELADPDPNVRAAAQAKWNDRRARNAAFFDGMKFPEKPKHLRGVPQELRAGWSEDIDPAFEDDVTCFESLAPYREEYADIREMSSKYVLSDISPSIPEDVREDLEDMEHLWRTVKPNRAIEYVDYSGDESQEEGGQADQGTCR